MYLFDKLKLVNSMAQNGTVEALLSEYFLTHLDNIKDVTLKEITLESKISRTSIIRFCQKAGYDGFTVFVDELSGEIEEQKKMLDNYQQLDVDFFKQMQVKFINEAENMAIPYYERLLAFIDESQKIFIYGNEKYVTCFNMLINKFFLLGKEVILNYNWDLKQQKEQFENLQANDLIIIIEPYMNYRTYHETLMITPNSMQSLYNTDAKIIYIGQDVDDKIAVSIPLPYTYYEILYRNFFIYFDMLLITKLNARGNRS